VQVNGGFLQGQKAVNLKYIKMLFIFAGIGFQNEITGCEKNFLLNNIGLE
jgi:hypothetical protein